MSTDLTPEERADLARLEAIIRSHGYPKRRFVPGRTKADKSDHVVYIIRDSTGTVIYVGISLNFAQRMSAHSQNSWWRTVASIELEHLPGRESALSRESALISQYVPCHNRAGVDR